MKGPVPQIQSCRIPMDTGQQEDAWEEPWWESRIDSVAEARGLELHQQLLQRTFESKAVWAKGLTVRHHSFHVEIFFSVGGRLPGQRVDIEGWGDEWYWGTRYKIHKEYDVYKRKNIDIQNKASQTKQTEHQDIVTKLNMSPPALC